MLRLLFFLLIIKPVAMLVLGLNIRRRDLLPARGPAIVVANHNSHLDTLVLMSLFPLRLIAKVHPVAAADYFLRNRWLSWFACNVIGIIPLERKPSAKGTQVLAPVSTALNRGDILILFPEGSRGEPEKMTKFKNGIAHLLSEHTTVAVTPVYFYGLGKSLPKGEFLLVPFFVDVFVGESLAWNGTRQAFMETLEASMQQLQQQAQLATRHAQEPQNTEART
jgi:1-acyl-sn-glycerol-3-phosphate acyltransferase